MSDWIDDSVQEFCRLMGLSVSSMPVAIEFEKRGLLNLERRGSQLLVLLSRPAMAGAKETQVKKALQLCYFKRQPVLNVQAALLGKGRMVFIARLKDEEVSVTNLERTVNQLTRMHDQLL